MADGVLVVLLLVFIWAAVLVPPAAGARASREAEFLGSIRSASDPYEGNLGGGRAPDVVPDQSRFRPALTANARRRQVLGGLVVAMGATLLLGLLPTFRLLLVVHLFLLNSCLAYVGLLVHTRDRAAGGERDASATSRQPAMVAVEPLYADGAEDEFESYESRYTSRVGAESTFADAYYGAEDGDDRDGGDGYGYESYEGEDDDLAEAAYIDELAQPA